MLSSCRPDAKDLIMKNMSRVKPDGGNGIPNGHLFFCQVYFVKMIGLVYFCNCAILSSSHFLFVKFTL